MTRWDIFVRAIAAALLDGDWEHEAMVARMRAVVVAREPTEDVEDTEADGEPAEAKPSWIDAVVELARTTFATPPTNAIGRFGWWLSDQPELGEWFDEARPTVVRFATPAPEMAESRWSVPALATIKELATWIGYDIDTLGKLADRRGIARDAKARHYRYTWVPKRTGGARLLEAPKPRLRVAQRRILDGILAQVPPHDAAHGFRAGCSVIRSAEPHVGREVVLRVDLQAFFTSVFAARVFGILQTAGYPEEVSRVIAALCTHRTPSDVIAMAPERDPMTLARLRAPHLPQGAPTSGALANLAAYRLDVRVAAFAAKLGARYTRYADDLVLSGDRTLARRASTIVARIAAIASEEGFSLNFRKTRVMTAAGRQRVTGIVVNEKLSVSRRDVDRLRALLYNCARYGPASQNRDGHADFRAHVRGRIAWVASVDAAKGARLQALFDRVRWG